MAGCKGVSKANSCCACVGAGAALSSALTAVGRWCLRATTRAWQPGSMSASTRTASALALRSSADVEHGTEALMPQRSVELPKQAVDQVLLLSCRAISFTTETLRLFAEAGFEG